MASTIDSIFNTTSGRALITAFDHGMSTHLPANRRAPLEVLRSIIKGGPDGLLIGPGMLRAGKELLSAPTAPVPVLRTDLTITEPEWLARTGEAYRVLLSPTQAQDLGAGAVCMFLVSGPSTSSQFADNVRAVAAAADEAYRIGIPLIVEATLWGSQHGTRRQDPADLAYICRIAFELGATAIKTEYTGDPQSMAEVISSVAVPVLTLGGGKTSMENVIAGARGALAAGASGLIFGRNIWASPDPVDVTRTLMAVVHG